MGAKVMIAGVGGASLGTEIYKSLMVAGGYDVYGCDISPTAYGLYESGFAGVYRIEREDYVNNVVKACLDAGAKWLICGGEQPMTLLSAAGDLLLDAGIRIVGNDADIVLLFSNKIETFRKLHSAGIPIPASSPVNGPEDVERVGLPCIVKPSTGSGGSASVFFAVSVDEAIIYADFIRRGGGLPLVQEYVGIEEGEFTVGVLSLPGRRIVGSIALRRDLSNKLSVSYQGRGGVVSSGYSQGYIDDFPDIRRQAEKIADSVGSQGPLNRQGRVRQGVFLPFEINPRFSASTHLRTLAGFNEIDMMLNFLRTGEPPTQPSVRPGWYLRSFTEQFVAKESVK